MVSIPLKILAFSLLSLAFLRSGIALAVGVEDFSGSDIDYPINLVKGHSNSKDRLVFFLSFKCDPNRCSTSCHTLGLERGACSIGKLPEACICIPQKSISLTLNSSVLHYFDHKPTDPPGKPEQGKEIAERVYQITIGNDPWIIKPSMSCTYPDNCSARCRIQSFQHGVCLNLLSRTISTNVSPSPSCACKGNKTLLYNVKTSRVAPFTSSEIDFVIQNTSIYAVTPTCREDKCQDMCETFNLANGICDHYRNQPACACATGFSNEESLADLNITSSLGGITQINGWNLVQLGQAACEKATCNSEVCKLLSDNPVEGKCFNEGLLQERNYCGCRAYKSLRPTAEELGSASSSAKGFLTLFKTSALISHLSICYMTLN